MITLVTAVFLASLLGSLHCVGMCGAFMAVVVGDSKSLAAQVGYHGGRLVSYLTLGMIAGAAGQSVNLAGKLAGLQPIALSLSAIAIVVMGTLTWLRLCGWQWRGVRGPTWVKKITAAGYRIAMRRPPLQRALSVGLLTTLLPCGWLWTFLLTAAGTAKPMMAAMTMMVFWLGTLPVMATLGVGLRGVLGRAQRRVPTFTCAAMIGVGLLTLVGRSHLNPLAWAAWSETQHASNPPCCEPTHGDDH